MDHSITAVLTAAHGMPAVRNKQPVRTWQLDYGISATHAAALLRAFSRRRLDGSVRPVYNSLSLPPLNNICLIHWLWRIARLLFSS